MYKAKKISPENNPTLNTLSPAMMQYEEPA